VACKRSLNVTWKSEFRQNYQPTFSPTVPPFAARISRIVWMWRHLAAKVGTSKTGSHNKPIGCNASGAYASDPDDEYVCSNITKLWKYGLCMLCSHGKCESNVVRTYQIIINGFVNHSISERCNFCVRWRTTVPQSLFTVVPYWHGYVLVLGVCVKSVSVTIFRRTCYVITAETGEGILRPSLRSG
jgi:hypothetical protein